MLDVCLLSVAAGIVIWLGLAYQGPAPETTRELFEGVSRLWHGPLPLACMFAMVVSMALCWTVMMATPGQLLVGCRVARASDGRPLNFLIATWRCLLLLLFGGVIGLPLITVVFDRRRRGLHDWLSFSVVVFEDESQIGLDQWKENFT